MVLGSEGFESGFSSGFRGFGSGLKISLEEIQSWNFSLSMLWGLTLNPKTRGILPTSRLSPVTPWGLGFRLYYGLGFRVSLSPVGFPNMSIVYVPPKPCFGAMRSFVDMSYDSVLTGIAS